MSDSAACVGQCGGRRAPGRSLRLRLCAGRGGERRAVWPASGRVAGSAQRAGVRGHGMRVGSVASWGQASEPTCGPRGEAVESAQASGFAACTRAACWIRASQPACGPRGVMAVSARESGVRLCGAHAVQRAGLSHRNRDPRPRDEIPRDEIMRRRCAPARKGGGAFAEVGSHGLRADRLLELEATACARTVRWFQNTAGNARLAP